MAHSSSRPVKRRPIRTLAAVLALAASAVPLRLHAQTPSVLASRWESGVLNRLEEARKAPPAQAAAIYQEVADRAEAFKIFSPETRDGLIPELGGRGKGKAVYPDLAVAYCHWRLAQLTGDQAAKEQQYVKVFEALQNIYTATHGLPGIRNHNANIYRAPIVFRMFVASALVLRTSKNLSIRLLKDDKGATQIISLLIALSLAERNHKTGFENEIANLMGQNQTPASPILVAGSRKEFDDLDLLRRETEDLVKSRLSTVSIDVDQHVAARAQAKSVLVSVTSPVPLDIQVEDTGGVLGKALSVDRGNVPVALGRKTVDRAGKGRVTWSVALPKLDLDQESHDTAKNPKTKVEELLADTERMKYSVLSSATGQVISLQIPPRVYVAQTPDSPIDGVAIRNLQVRVEDAMAGDRLIARVGERMDGERLVTRAGDHEAALDLAEGTNDKSISDLRIPPNVKSVVQLFVLRGDEKEPIAVCETVPEVSSEPSPIVSAQVVSLPSGVRAARIEVRDFEPVKTLWLGTEQHLYPTAGVPLAADADGRTGAVYYVPLWKREALTARAESRLRSSRTVSESGVRSTANEAEIRRQAELLPEAEPYKSLLTGNQDAAETQYWNLLKAGQRREEALAFLVPAYERRLNLARQAPQDDRPVRLAELRTYADPLGGTYLEDLNREIKEQPHRFVITAKALTKEPGATQLYVISFHAVGQQLEVSDFGFGQYSRSKGSGDYGNYMAGGEVTVLVPIPAGDSLSLSLMINDRLAMTNRVERNGVTREMLAAAASMDPAELKGALAEQYRALRAPLTEPLASLPEWLLAEAASRARREVQIAVQAVRDAQVGGAVDKTASAVKAVAKLAELAADAKLGITQAELSLLKDDLKAAVTPADVAASLVRTGGKIKGGTFTISSKAPDLSLKVDDLPGSPVIAGARDAGGSFTFRIPDSSMPAGMEKPNALRATLRTTSLGGGDLALRTISIGLREESVKISVRFFGDGADDKSGILVARRSATYDDVRSKPVVWKCNPVNVALARVRAYPVSKQATGEWTTIDAEHLKTLNGVPVEFKDSAPGTYKVEMQFFSEGENPENSPPGFKTDTRLQLDGPGVALVIGNNYYDTGNVYLPLGHPADDARAVVNMLHDKFHFADDNIIHAYGYGGRGVAPRLDSSIDLGKKALNKDMFEALVAEAVSQARRVKASYALVYLAGHGAIDEGRRNYILADGQTKFLGYAAQNLSEALSAVAHDENPKAGPEVASQRLVVGVYDACQTAVKGVNYPPALTDENGGPLVLSVLACRNGESSRENSSTADYQIAGDDGKKFQNGFFTHALLQAAEEATSLDGYSLQSLVTRTDEILQKLMIRAQEVYDRAKAAGKSDLPYSSGGARPEQHVDIYPRPAQSSDVLRRQIEKTLVFVDMTKQPFQLRISRGVQQVASRSHVQRQTPVLRNITQGIASAFGR